MPFGYKNWHDFVIDVSQYYTVKFVAIQYWPLGCCNYAIKLIIFLYIVVYTIIYNNGHLKVHIRQGSGLIRKRVATVNNCYTFSSGCKTVFLNPTDYEFCSQFTGIRKNNSKKQIRVLPCDLVDSMMLQDGIVVSGAQFITMKTTKYNVSQGCTPNATNGFTCNGRVDALSKISENYILGFNSQRLLLVGWVNNDMETERMIGDHPKAFLRTAFPMKVQSFRKSVRFWQSTIQDTRRKVGNAPQESSLRQSAQNEPSAAFNPAPIPFGNLVRIPEEKSFQQGERMSGTWRAVFRRPNGEIAMTVSDVVRLATGDAAIIGNRATIFDMVDRAKNKSVRELGRVVLLFMYYTNRAHFDPFGKKNVRLEVSAQLLNIPSEVYTTAYNAEQSTFTIKHGVLILIVSSANLQTFDMSCTLSVLAASVVLFAASAVIVDYMMMYAPGFDNWRYRMVKRQPWHKPIVDPYLFPPAKSVPATNTYDTSKIYESIMLRAAENNRSLQKEELFVLFAKLDIRLNKLDAFHMEETTGGQQIQRYLDAFEVAYIAKTS